MNFRAMHKAAVSATHNVETVVPMSMSANVVAVHDQLGVPTIWFINDTFAPQIDRRFVTYWTGQQFDADGPSYVGTSVGAHLVCHVFEVV